MRDRFQGVEIYTSLRKNIEVLGRCPTPRGKTPRRTGGVWCKWVAVCLWLGGWGGGADNPTSMSDTETRVGRLNRAGRGGCLIAPAGNSGGRLARVVRIGALGCGPPAAASSQGPEKRRAQHRTRRGWRRNAGRLNTKRRRKFDGPDGRRIREQLYLGAAEISLLGRPLKHSARNLTAAGQLSADYA